MINCNIKINYGFVTSPPAGLTSPEPFSLLLIVFSQRIGVYCMLGFVFSSPNLNLALSNL